MQKGLILLRIKNDAVNKFRIFPDSFSSAANLNIQVLEHEEGYYSFQLYDQYGHSVHRQEIWIDAEAGLLNLDVPPVSAGNYFLTLTSKKSGQKFSENIVIQ